MLCPSGFPDCSFYYFNPQGVNARRKLVCHTEERKSNYFYTILIIKVDKVRRICYPVNIQAYEGNQALLADCPENERKINY